MSGNGLSRLGYRLLAVLREFSVRVRQRFGEKTGRRRSHNNDALPSTGTDTGESQEPHPGTDNQSEASLATTSFEEQGGCVLEPPDNAHGSADDAAEDSHPDQQLPEAATALATGPVEDGCVLQPADNVHRSSDDAAEESQPVQPEAATALATGPAEDGGILEPAADDAAEESQADQQRPEAATALATSPVEGGGVLEPADDAHGAADDAAEESQADQQRSEAATAVAGGPAEDGGILEPADDAHGAADDAAEESQADQQRPEATGPVEDGGVLDPPDDAHGTTEGGRRPTRYRPTHKAGLRPSPNGAPARKTGSVGIRVHALSIDVRALFERGGFLKVSLLPRREATLPDEITTSAGDFVALQDDWYQDVAPPELGTLLYEGVEWSVAPPNGKLKWSLAGRDIYVLSRHARISGYVSTSRMALGDQHVVLCIAQRADEVLDALSEAGCAQSDKLDESMGMPHGWIAFKDVKPTRVVPLSGQGDILDILRPRADVEIILDGGIRIGRNAWLLGFPPNIRLHGDVSCAGPLLIDGKQAVADASGHFSAPDWQVLGVHRVWCHGMSFQYVIQDGCETWEPWDAHVWSLSETDCGEPRRPGICGLLVRAPSAAPVGSCMTTVPASNLILIGASPGEIQVCVRRNDIRVTTYVAFPWFEPVWALPSNLLHCDNKIAKVVLVGKPQMKTILGKARGNVDRWCAAILAASRKRLHVSPDDARIAALWSEYRKHARALQRRQP